MSQIPTLKFHWNVMIQESINKKLEETEACTQDKITQALAKVKATNAREEEAIEKAKGCQY